MQNSKLLSILKAFSAGEIREFRKFIDSPFFNKEGSYLLRFYDELRKSYPEFSGEELAKERLFRKLYKDKEYNDATMRKLTSGIIKLAGDYLRFTAYINDPDTSDLLFVKKIREKRIEKLFESESGILDKKLRSMENTVDLDYFRNRYKLELEKINFYMDFNHLIKKQQESMKAVQNYVVYDSLLNLLDIGFNILVGSTTMYKGNEDITLKFLDNMNLEVISEILKRDSPEFFPVFELFYKRFLGFRDFEDDRSYYIYKEIALKNLNYLTWENQFTIFISLQNICTRKFIEGKRYFTAELHDVHKEMLSRGLFVQHSGDFMNLQTYRNIVLTASNLHNNDWITGFMNEYLPRILPEQQESLRAWSKAIVLYNKNEFSGALKELQSVKNDHYLTKHEIKAMTMKMFYELNEFESGISFAESYRKMVQNDKTYAEIHRNSYTNFSILYLKLIKMKADKNYGDAEFLKLEIEKTVTNSKEWLLAKADEMIRIG